MTEVMVAAENKAAGVNSDSAPRSGALRCAFTHAPDPVYSNTQNYGAKFMPVWAYTLASHVPDDGHFEMALHDTRFDSLDDIGAADVFMFSGIN